MNSHLNWMMLGAALIILEAVLPGGIVVFLGIAAIIVGSSIYMGWITSAVTALIIWFMISLVLLLVLRSIFIKYFEGDSKKHDVNEESEYLNSVVEVTEEILPYKEGRVKFRDSSWFARSDSKISATQKAVIVGKDGNHWIVKPID